MIKSFDKAGLLDLSFAIGFATEGDDQIFRFKFSKRVASKVAMIDVKKPSQLSLRCIIHVMTFFSRSSYIGQECWQVISKLLDKHCQEARFPLKLHEIKILLTMMTNYEIVSQAVVSSVFNDIINLMESSRLSYTDIYDLIVLIFSINLKVPKAIDIFIDYYVQKGYDEDELKLLGNTKACKLLKAFEKLNPNSTSRYNPMF